MVWKLEVIAVDTEGSYTDDNRQHVGFLCVCVFVKANQKK